MEATPLVLTFEVEDRLHLHPLSPSLPAAAWPGYITSVERDTHRVLDLLADCRATATFFVLGWVGERLPALAHEIGARGHEIALHGWFHEPIHSGSAKALRAELQRGKALLEDASGTAVAGYRAPEYSIVRRTLWALEAAAAEGFRYDSSIRRPLKGWPKRPAVVATPAGPILEVPPILTRGFRLLPEAAIRAAVSRAAVPVLAAPVWEGRGEPRLRRLISERSAVPVSQAICGALAGVERTAPDVALKSPRAGARRYFDPRDWV